MKTQKHPTLANGQPAISCLRMDAADLLRRVNAAHVRAEKQLADTAHGLTGEDLLSVGLDISRHTLWHVEFPNGLRILVCDNQLFRVAADLPSQLVEANGGQALDFYDYGYVADVLRELLARGHAPKGDKLCLRRALAWAEERGTMKWDFSRERD